MMHRGFALPRDEMNEGAGNNRMKLIDERR